MTEMCWPTTWWRTSETCTATNRPASMCSRASHGRSTTQMAVDRQDSGGRRGGAQGECWCCRGRSPVRPHETTWDRDGVTHRDGQALGLSNLSVDLEQRGLAWEL